MIKEISLPKYVEMLIDEDTDMSKLLEVIKTSTMIDTGHWFLKSRIWLAFTSEELILVAVGRRRYIEKVPFSECGESYYCHATGELVLEPIETLMYKRLKMTPADALKVLKAIGIDISLGKFIHN